MTDAPESEVVQEPDGDEAVGNGKVRAALQLVERQWEAEQENARRLATRTTGILTAIAVVSGFGVFKIPSLVAVQPPWLSIALRVCVIALATFMLLGLVFILDLRPPAKTPEEPSWRLIRKLLRLIRRWAHSTDGRAQEDRLKHPFASSFLLAPAEPGGKEPKIQDPDLLHLTQEVIEQVEYYRLAMAAVDLHVRNVERQAAMVTGQAWLARAVLLGAVIAAALILAQ